MNDVTTEPATPETPPAAVVADAPSVEVTPAPEVLETPETPRQEDKKWAIAEITKQRARVREAESRAGTLEQQLRDAQAMISRLQPGNGDAPAPAPTPPAPRMDDAEVDRRADYKLFVRDVQNMRNQGVQEFGAGFNDTIRALEAYGATDDAFVAQVLAVDPANAHKLLDSLAKDPEKAVSLVGMDPTRRIAELTRLSMSATAPKTAEPTPTPAPAPKPAPKAALSRAPAPPPPVEPTSHKEVDWRSDDASDEEFDRGFAEMMKRRSARR